MANSTHQLQISNFMFMLLCLCSPANYRPSALLTHVHWSSLIIFFSPDVLCTSWHLMKRSLLHKFKITWTERSHSCIKIKFTWKKSKVKIKSKLRSQPELNLKWSNLVKISFKEIENLKSWIKKLVSYLREKPCPWTAQIPWVNRKSGSSFWGKSAAFIEEASFCFQSCSSWAHRKEACSSFRGKLAALWRRQASVFHEGMSLKHIAWEAFL